MTQYTDKLLQNLVELTDTELQEMYTHMQNISKFELLKLQTRLAGLETLTVLELKHRRGTKI